MVKEEYVKLEKKGVYSVHLNEGKKRNAGEKMHPKKARYARHVVSSNGKEKLLFIEIFA